jgi:hypothetical protein
MSTFYYLWRASDAARNLDLMVMVGMVGVQFACYKLLDTKELPISLELAKRIYILSVIGLDLVCTIVLGIKTKI